MIKRDPIETPTLATGSDAWVSQLLAHFSGLVTRMARKLMEFELIDGRLLHRRLLCHMDGDSDAHLLVLAASDDGSDQGRFGDMPPRATHPAPTTLSGPHSPFRLSLFAECLMIL